MTCTNVYTQVDMMLTIVTRSWSSALTPRSGGWLATCSRPGMTMPSPPSPLKTLTNIAINVLHVFLSIINHLAFTIQIKSLDMSTFFLPYFLSPKPAGIRAANLEQGGEVVFQTLGHSPAAEGVLCRGQDLCHSLLCVLPHFLQIQLAVLWVDGKS